MVKASNKNKAKASKGGGGGPKTAKGGDARLKIIARNRGKVSLPTEHQCLSSTTGLVPHLSQKLVLAYLLVNQNNESTYVSHF
jgi:hypothetical protein